SARHPRKRQDVDAPGVRSAEPSAWSASRVGSDLGGLHLMPVNWNRNRLTEKLGIDYPIVQGPLGGLSSQRLTAAVSNFGGLGSFGALNLSPEEIKNVISQIRSLTSRPFAVNLWVSMEDDEARTSDEAAFNRSLTPLAIYFEQLN